jgi:hypothetical protein
MSNLPAWTAEARALGTCVLAVKQPIPELGALTGDEIVIRPEDPEVPRRAASHVQPQCAQSARRASSFCVAVLYHEPGSDRPPLTLVR